MPIESSSVSVLRAVFHGVAVLGALCLVHCGGSGAGVNSLPPEEAGSGVPILPDAGADAPLPEPPDTGAHAQCDGQGSPQPQGRPQALACPATNPASFGAPEGGGVCTTDADCAEGGSTFRWCLAGVCSVDQCVTDANCPSGQACGCANMFGGNAIHANACVEAACRVDADCAALGSGVCSPSRGARCGGLTGYQCHSPADDCQSDADCCGDKPACRYQTPLGHWACEAISVCNG
jgi:hypothetical protein